MSYFSTNAISVPTKRDSPEAGAAGGAALSGAQGGIRRNSSNSSLDVAATIFSSMQELEASGRNLSSLGTLDAAMVGGGVGGGMGLGSATSALDSLGGGGMGGSGGAMHAAMGQRGGAGGMGAGASGMENGLGGGMGGLRGATSGGPHSSLNGLLGTGNFTLPSSTGGDGKYREGGMYYDSKMKVESEAQATYQSLFNSAGVPSRSFGGLGLGNSSNPLPIENQLSAASAGYNMMGGGGMGGGSAASSIDQLRSMQQAQALRQLQMEQIILQHNNRSMGQQQLHQPHASMLGSLKGGYTPGQSNRQFEMEQIMLQQHHQNNTTTNNNRSMEQQRALEEMMLQQQNTTAKNNFTMDQQQQRALENMMLQHQPQSNTAPNSNNPMELQQQQQQCASMMGSLREGYAPRHSRLSRRRDSGSSLTFGANDTSNNNQLPLPENTRGNLGNYTQSELLREVSRRQTQRRNSGDLLKGMDDIRRPGSASLMDAFSRGNPRERDDLVDLYNQMGHRGSMVSRANSFDSFSSLALMARNNGQRGDGEETSAMPSRNETKNDTTTKDRTPEDPQEQQQPRQKKQRRLNGDDAVANGPAAKQEDGSDATNSSVVTDTQSPRPPAADGGGNSASAVSAVKSEDNKSGEEDPKLSRRKRNHSSSSFDALISVFGDELAELDRKKNDEESGEGKEKSKDDAQQERDDRSVDFFNNLIEKKAVATVAAKQQEEEAKNGGSVFTVTTKEGDTNGSKKRRFSSTSSISEYPKISLADELGAGPTSQHPKQPTEASIAGNTSMKGGAISQMNVLQEREMNAVLSGSRDSRPIPSTGPTRDYSQKMQSTASMMASLEALRRDELAMRELALRDDAIRKLQSQRAALGPSLSGMPNYPNDMMAAAAAQSMGPLVGDAGHAEMGRYTALFGGRVPCVMANMGAAENAADAMLARLQRFPPEGNQMPPGSVLSNHHRNHTAHSSQLPVPHITPSTSEKPLIPKAVPNQPKPDVVLKRFLDEYGEDGKKRLTSLLEAIADTEKSLASIHAWDRSQGLRKCHSRTVVKTRRSRAKLKAFLMGVDAPKEPPKKKKKKPKREKKRGGLE